jgi:hypothetical protein
MGVIVFQICETPVFRSLYSNWSRISDDWYRIRYYANKLLLVRMAYPILWKHNEEPFFWYCIECDTKCIH